MMLSVDEKILCKSSNGGFFDAKVIKVDTDENGEPKYLIHYHGMKKSFDTWITQAELPENVKKLSKEALDETKTEEAEAELNQSVHREGQSKPVDVAGIPTCNIRRSVRISLLKTPNGTPTTSKTKDDAPPSKASTPGTRRAKEESSATPPLAVTPGNPVACDDSAAFRTPVVFRTPVGNTPTQSTAVVSGVSTDERPSTSRNRRKRPYAATENITDDAEATGEAVDTPEKHTGNNTEKRVMRSDSRRANPTSTAMKDNTDGYLERHFPDELKNMTIEHHIRIHDKAKIVKLPTKSTVAKIIDDFCADVAKEKSNKDGKGLSEEGERLKEAMKAVQQHFNDILPNRVLYEPEKQQYLEIMKKRKVGSGTPNGVTSKRAGYFDPVPSPLPAVKAFVPSKIYGLIHLLRFLTEFEEILKPAKFYDDTKSVMLEVVIVFAEWLNERKSIYFDATTAYMDNTFGKQ